jgi:hypothetical protein
MKQNEERAKIEKAKAMTDKELKWAIFGQCFQSNYEYLEILQREQARREVLNEK